MVGKSNLIYWPTRAENNERKKKYRSCLIITGYLQDIKRLCFLLARCSSSYLAYQEKCTNYNDFRDGHVFATTWISNWDFISSCLSPRQNINKITRRNAIFTYKNISYRLSLCIIYVYIYYEYIDKTSLNVRCDSFDTFPHITSFLVIWCTIISAFNVVA